MTSLNPPPSWTLFCRAEHKERPIYCLEKDPNRFIISPRAKVIRSIAVNATYWYHSPTIISFVYASSRDQIRSLICLGAMEAEHFKIIASSPPLQRLSVFHRHPCTSGHSYLTLACSQSVTPGRPLITPSGKILIQLDSEFLMHDRLSTDRRWKSRPPYSYQFLRLKSKQAPWILNLGRCSQCNLSVSSRPQARWNCYV